ncbi:cubilin-like protein, partial [Dinothrombium tinctorium]
ECEKTFTSTADGPKNGSFKSPYIENYENYSRQCIYTFQAAENERVQLWFTSFDLRGTPPDCVREYLDIYAEVQHKDQSLIETPFGGRYCSRKMPLKRVSLYQILVISFHTNFQELFETAFEGFYEFIDASPYTVGTPIPNQICSFLIHSEHKREGSFMTPTYPGVYPKNLQCSYSFIGRKGQRVRIEFIDFDLFYGGEHCPFDYVKVYDGLTTNDPLIYNICGQKRNFAIYSSAESLLVQFSTLKRTADGQNRGFSAWFEFSERFVNLGFIGKADGEHIKGTECDQKILSRKESNGTVYSPNYPFLYHSNTVCKYYIYGLQDDNHLEKVRLEFEKFEIPVPTSDLNECVNASVKIFLTGESLEEPDYVFCGTETPPPPVVSDGPVLVMVFSSGTSQGSGFKGRYSFETDYRVPGTPDPPGCRFKYESSGAKSGEFNSPRYPSSYPASTRCEYVFIGNPGEQIEIVFEHFKFKAELVKGAGYNDACKEDYIKITEVYPSGREQTIGVYCTISAPGPFLSNIGVQSVKILLETDAYGQASGFSASYNFLPVQNILGDCGENITNLSNGVIVSPQYPQPYPSQRQVCNWYITVKPRHKILLYFENFLIEGQMDERGCPAAVVRVWRDFNQPPLEMCGNENELTNETRELISATDMLKISKKSVGSTGFKAVWTEIKDEQTCDMYKCPKSGYCISQDLKCNGISNCGHYDKADEVNCIANQWLTQRVKAIFLAGIHVKKVNEMMMFAMIAVGLVLFVIVFASLCHRKRKRRRRPNISSQFEVTRCKQTYNLPPPGTPPYLSVESV